MKKLKQFVKFDTQAFFENKKMLIKEIKPTLEYIDGKPTGKVLGTTFGLVIVEDATVYGEEIGLNSYEQFNLKINGDTELIKTRISPNTIIKFNKYEGLSATIFGQFQNQLSVTYQGQGFPFAKLKNE